MDCCKDLKCARMQTLPFGRVLSTGYYDGPIEGFTECSQCKRVYSFRKLDWDDSQDVRVLGFAPLHVTLDSIASQLGQNPNKSFMLVPPLSGSSEKLVKDMLDRPPACVVAVDGWPGRVLATRDVTGLNLDAASDWFEFLGLPRES